MLLLALFACSENNLVDQTKDPSGDDTATAAPDIAVTPAAVGFGDVLPGAVSTAIVTVANEGAADLFVDDAALQSPPAGLTVSALSSPVLAPGADLELVVTWEAGVDPLASVLRIVSNDPDEARIDVPIGGNVLAGDIRIEPAYHDFGSLMVGTSAAVDVTVSNVGVGPLTIDRWEYGTADGDLAVTDEGGLASLPLTLDAGASTVVTVTYTPSAAGGDEGTLTVWSDDPDTPTTGAQQAGSGEDDPCLGFTQTVSVMLTADDAWEGWIDGAAFSGAGANSWSTSDTVEWELECGDHALSLHARDTAMVTSGVLAVVWVEGTVRFVSGPSNWTMVDVAPTGDWTSPDFDDSSWHIPEVCANTSPWGTWPQPFYDLGAQWIWWTTRCSDLGEAWLRLNFTVP